MPTTRHLLLLFPLALGLVRADPRTDAVQLARVGDFGRALPVLEQLAAGGDATAQADLVAVYTWAGRPADALAAWSALPPDARPGWVQTDVARALADLGGGLGARAVAGAGDPALDAAAGASLTRLTTVGDRDPAQRFATADRALADLGRQLVAARARPEPDGGIIRRLTLDRWVALRARVRMAEIAAEFSRWPEPATALPPYALAAVGDALLYLEKPEQARELYREARRRDPDNLELAQSLFYAEVECEDFAAAYALVDALDAAQPAGFTYTTEAAPRDNPDKLGLAVTAALARYYADELASAWRRIEPLARAAPGNGYVRRESAAVMAARGWPRRALTELARVETLDPGETATHLARTELLFATRQYAATDDAITALGAAYPENKAVQRLLRNRELLGRPEFYLSYEHENGGGPDLSGGSWGAQAELWAPPLAHEWRLMAGYTAAQAAIPEGEVDLAVPVAGLEWRRGFVDLLAQAGRLESTRDSTHARLRGRWQATDTWSAEVTAAAHTPDLPLRALHYGLTADSLAASLGWAPHESRRLTVGGQATRFSSGNRRTEGSATWRERLYERPHLDLDLLLDASVQTNSRSGEPYYAPARAWDGGVGLEANHVIHRRYRTAWVQEASLHLGRRAERGFGAGTGWSAGYGLRRDFSDALAGHVTITTGSARYDGANERFTRWELSLHGRF
ncbi:Poly-beta-1,6-N-acetyl-D-glucosamine export protein precursor [Lacunisphaera limnophila]|uniref:Poly-beta-1,6-N-acetyl-D-glucosamine export protein n=1 Tax=Lacunisphaera limnophila TaxID=1838286 RepID=A0A1D8ARY2_9BACT|nr:poly-beta-1,6 N-acetyl-D-glucosamine export porin PgaA [Lacunisphaera limnophila]AOS43630.1 Poly-beta-1,6-N-acetyl-D-glucosamine export protein precursor [Lacunisphaera limnophila]